MPPPESSLPSSNRLLDRGFLQILRLQAVRQQIRPPSSLLGRRSETEGFEESKLLQRWVNEGTKGK
ncbi:hypothetical protein GP486_000410 [Trichoglossum hirsutum]|uniref:Uncharacterized protein n=1 Tax=Trichoglossum hirsutum TaxID=265104 RepID=A0A9P8LIM5_9PEZI|nr:hypothetical protein GP486_000410 [Trichoglossum hirsutum]